MLFRCSQYCEVKLSFEPGYMYNTLKHVFNLLLLINHQLPILIEFLITIID